MGVYQHFREEEHPFIDQIYSYIEQVQRTYEHRLTDFLDPREQSIVKAIIGQNNSDFQLYFFGGYPESERKRAIIAPFYEEITDDSFQLTVLEGSFHQKFVSISHRDVMGAFLSLGIDRSKLGDIIIAEGIFQIITDEPLTSYLLTNFVMVNRAKVQLKTRRLEEIIEPTKNWQTLERVVPSLRLDAVVSALYNISRKQATSLIERGHVKVNFTVVDQAAYTLEEGDLISTRGKGRGKFIEELGATRKNNLKVQLALLKEK